MENNNSENKFRDLSEAKGYLESRFKKEVDLCKDSVTPTLVDSFNSFVDESNLLMKSIKNIARDTTRDKLWREFMARICTKSKFHDELLSDVAVGLNKELSRADSSADIVKLAGELAYARGGGIRQDLVAHQSLIVSTNGVRELINGIFSETTEVDAELSKLLDDSRAYIKENSINGSFVLLKQVGSMKLGFGVQIDQDGEIVNVGIEDITAPCRELKFERMIKTLPDIKDGVRLLSVTSDFNDYPDRFHNPYSVPADLFLLNSTCGHNWVNRHLENTKIGMEIRSALKRTKENQESNIHYKPEV
jgi:hypothetical protein